MPVAQPQHVCVMLALPGEMTTLVKCVLYTVLLATLSLVAVICRDVDFKPSYGQSVSCGVSDEQTTPKRFVSIVIFCGHLYSSFSVDIVLYRSCCLFDPSELPPADSCETDFDVRVTYKIPPIENSKFTCSGFGVFSTNVISLFIAMQSIGKQYSTIVPRVTLWWDGQHHTGEGFSDWDSSSDYDE